jgi:hypothetical protein
LCFESTKMMIISCSETQQDIVQICARNSISDITFYDSNNIITHGLLDSCNRFPYLFIEKTRQIQYRERTSLIKLLKPGQDLPAQPFHNDWILGIIFIVAFVYSLIRATSKSMLPDIARILKLRGKSDPASRINGGFFNWESTILNLISFMIFGLFSYSAASYYNFIPIGIGGIFFWLISLSIIISAATIRHILCVIAGTLSGEKEVFREYLLGVYISYRFSALALFVLVLLMSYTLFFPAKEGIFSGIVVLTVMYLISVIRLSIIFLNRNISIFYLILYLCALEILPVVISVKYFAGLV